MNTLKRLLAAFLFFLVSTFSVAEEGMWLPMLLSKYTIGDMQKMGCRLTAEQIYSVNQHCLKDAIVALDHGGCTGSIISSKGLLITNHHCGYDAIADQSGVDKDYLTEGFWAMRPEEELPLPGKSVSFLLRMEDVTERVLSAVSDTMNEEERASAILERIDEIVKEISTDEGVEASVESMFEGNEFYLFVYRTFTDIRMVGAPPSAIGKFGGETDNWMWPRHTGDFCLLRVYSSPDGKPAAFSKGNIPWNAPDWLKISLKGIKENDFTMILGYPGSTDRYLTSEGIRYKLEALNPADIASKYVKLQLMKGYMDADDATRIAYAGDYAYLANFWKKSVQESKALTRLRVYNDRKAEEQAFREWAAQEPGRLKEYGSIPAVLDSLYARKKMAEADVALTWLMETFTGSKVLMAAYHAMPALRLDDETLREELLVQLQKDFKGFNTSLEYSLLNKMLLQYSRNVNPAYYPSVFSEINKKYKGNLESYLDDLFKRSYFVSLSRAGEFLNKPSRKKMEKDPAYKLVHSIFEVYLMINYRQSIDDESLTLAKRSYLKGIREMEPNRLFYPDANSTLRLTYGSVKPYKAADAAFYDYYTTLEGVMEKEDTTNREFIVPLKLKSLYDAKDYGRYGENGTLPVCFIATLDITGGNSGSPVMNATGGLIGVAFDGNSESMSSDIKYDARVQRTICVDIRYVLFVIDKFANAGYLVDEMTLEN